MRPRAWCLIALAALALAPWHARPAGAQTLTGSLIVRVTDVQGGVLPGTVVTVTSPALLAPVAGVTGEDGMYQAPALPPAQYAVRFELPGFGAVERRDVPVGLDRATSLAVELPVAGVREVVVVGAPTIDPTSTNLSTSILRGILEDTPGGRDVSSLLEYKASGLVTDRADVGGSESGLQAGFVAHGTPHGQNTQALNGVNVTDPVATGFSVFYYDFDTLDEVQVSTAAHSVEVGPPGVYVNLLTRTATDRWRGDAGVYYQSDATQSDNIDGALRAQGVEKAGFDFLSDAAVQAGGPLGRRLRVFGAYRDWRVHRFVSGFEDDDGTPIVEPTDLFSSLLNGTFQATPNHRVTAFWARQDYRKPQRGASALVTDRSTWNERDVLNISQGLWHGVLGGRTLLQARVSYLDVFFPLYIQDAARAAGSQATYELTTGTITGAAPFEYVFQRRRLQANTTLSWFADRWLGSRHELVAGWDVAHSPNEFTQRGLGDVVVFVEEGFPAFVERYATPIDAHETVRSLAFFASDTLQFRRTSVNAGVRFERMQGIVPAQTSPAGTFAPARTFDALGTVIDWTSLSPRAGVVHQLTGDGRTVLKVNGARYYHQMSTVFFTAANPNGLAGEGVLWADLNEDLRFQPDEAGETLYTFGGVQTSIDPDLKPPHTDELLVALEREVTAGLRLGGVLTLRRDRNQVGLRDVTSVWIPTMVEDPETGALLTVYDKAVESIGTERFRVINSPTLDQDFRGFEVLAHKRLSEDWQLLGSYAVSRALTEQALVPPADIYGTSAVSVDPNDTVNARGPTAWDRTHVFKASASYRLPFDVLVAGNVRSQSGPVFTRTLSVPLTQGFETVFAEPRSESTRLDALTTVDVRGSKTLRFGNGRRVEVLVDVYNLFNANTVLDASSLTGPAFGTPLGVLAPRIVRIGGRVGF